MRIQFLKDNGQPYTPATWIGVLAGGIAGGLLLMWLTAVYAGVTL